MIETGLNFTDGIREYEILRFYRNNFYLLKNYTENREDELMTDEQINGYINRKEELQNRLNRHKQYIIESEKREEEERQKEIAKQKEYEFCYGFADNQTLLQKGRILKILNTKQNYYNSGIFIGNMTRKSFIEKVLKDGGKVEHKKDMKYYSKRVGTKIKENEYRLYLTDDKNNNSESFYEITKIEYDYSNHLLQIGL